MNILHIYRGGGGPSHIHRTVYCGKHRLSTNNQQPATSNLQPFIPLYRGIDSISEREEVLK
jgi:hypothetical protein